MRKRDAHLLTFGFLVIAMLLAGAIPAKAGVNVNINVGPPPIVVEEPPEVVVVPNSRVYFVPQPEVDVFFFGGYWWSPRGDRWYRATAYNGPWIIVERRRVPREVILVPRDYRVRYVRERHIPYGQWKKEHKHWEKEEHKARKEERKREKEEWKEEKRERKHGRGHDRDD